MRQPQVLESPRASVGNGKSGFPLTFCFWSAAMICRVAQRSEYNHVAFCSVLKTALEHEKCVERILEEAPDVL